MRMFKFFSLFLFTSLAFLCGYHIYTVSEKILPKSVQINIPDEQIKGKISGDVSDLIKLAAETGKTRSEFLGQLADELEQIDFIHQFWIRLGLDEKLQIDAVMQTPVMILESKDSKTYLIGSRMNIIAQNPAREKFPGLYALSLPETKIVWQPKDKQKKSIRQNQDDESLNLPWIINQANMIHTYSQSLGSEYFFSKLSWTTDTGFVLTMLRKPSDMTFIVFLGHSDIARKIGNLKIMLTELGTKNLYPHEIDLNYPDKANFKL